MVSWCHWSRLWICFCVALLVPMGASVAADVETQTAAAYLTKLHSETDAFDKISTELLEMTAGALGSDYDIASEVFWNTHAITLTMNHYIEVTGLYRQMVNDRDRAIVLSRVRALRANIPIYLEHRTAAVNKFLPRLKSPAVVAQVERVRNQMRRLHETIVSWSP